MNFKEIDEARKILELGESATLQEIKDDWGLGSPPLFGKVLNLSTIIWINASHLPTLPQVRLLLIYLIYQKN